MDYANFMAYLGVLIFIILVIGGIIYAQRLAQKEQEMRALMTKAKRLTHRASEVWEVIQDAQNYVASNEVMEALINFYTYILTQREHLFPQPDTSTLVANAETLKTQYNQNNPTHDLTNDFEIKRCKSTFTQTQKILKAAANKNILHNESLMELSEKLKRTLLDLEVNAYEKLGDQAGERKNPAVATNYYKFAKKLLIESDVIYQGKHERIRNITDKTQILFGNAVQDQLDRKQEDLELKNEFGLPDDLNVMQGKARKKD